eukprot:TRINITY_DN21602_c2_g1_i1.p2 TRINITY_DN21602_c2_g1~~TRINITY_DN21602_c2_g1_i1.p2  ORF type:complete len:188 (-),score=23.86 TRINITY_DN21602_c2_g1_i1:165-728(-)
MLHARAVHHGDDILAQGIPTSPAAGLFHLQTAAVLRHVRAAVLCAQLYGGIRPTKAAFRALIAAQPNRFEPCNEAAARYLEIAAQQGVVGAMTSLAMRFAEGDGVMKSVSEACCWYQEAVNVLGRGNNQALEAAEFDAEALPNSLSDVGEIREVLGGLESGAMCKGMSVESVGSLDLEATSAEDAQD